MHTNRILATTRDRPAVLQVRNLVKQFGDTVAVDALSFNVQQGEIFAFLGGTA
ncbi:hypothetical protein [Corynebacterium deserti]|uniref:hypothetical protein n=1 Tax=Corynebacterium deserti TaxID=1408191 RepID=UPI001E3652B7|nr:hypothetical protein [Corynebacterium deserti]